MSLQRDDIRPIIVVRLWTIEGDVWTRSWSVEDLYNRDRIEREKWERGEVDAEAGRAGMPDLVEPPPFLRGPVRLWAPGPITFEAWVAKGWEGEARAWLDQL